MPWRDRLSTSWASPRQLGARVAVAVAAVLVAGVPFCLLLLFVQTHWGPLLEVDDSARDGLHGYALAHPLFVTLMRLASDSGSATAWQVVTVLLAGFLLWRRRVRLALFVVVTIAGSSLVNSLVKASVNRARPVVDHPLLHEPGQSFPSGHAQAAAAGYAVLLVLVLPHLNRVGRRVAGTVAVLMVAAIGFSRVALAAHYVSDVVAAYLLGLAWVAVMAAVFQVWRHGTPYTRASEPAPQAAQGGRPA
jgi:undecaprenyl-diphosphatase